MKKTTMTAQELLSQLAKDENFVQRQKNRQMEMSLLASQLATAELPVIEALNDVGVVVSSVWDLVNERRSFPNAQSVLLAHLQKDYPERIREGIARAMADPAARFAWSKLKQIYVSEPHGTVKDALAIALSACADTEEKEQLAELVVDTSQGNSRLLLAIALRNFSAEELLAIQSRISTDDVVWKSVASALQKKIERKAK